MKKTSILSFALLCLTTNLFANSLTNQSLVKSCKDPAAGPQNYCYGFIIAAANGANFYRNIADVNDEFIDICLPKDLLPKDLVAEYIQWVEQNPSEIETPAFVGVTTSFSRKYSCPPPKKSKKKKLLVE